jgi:hypothetical protein
LFDESTGLFRENAQSWGLRLGLIGRSHRDTENTELLAPWFLDFRIPCLGRTRSLGRICLRLPVQETEWFATLRRTLRMAIF